MNKYGILLSILDDISDEDLAIFEDAHTDYVLDANEDTMFLPFRTWLERQYKDWLASHEDHD